MNIDKELVSIQRFIGTKLYIWKWQIYNLFQAQGPLGHIDGPADHDDIKL